MTAVLLGACLVLTISNLYFISKYKHEKDLVSLHKVRGDTWSDQFYDMQTKYLADTSRLESVIVNARFQISELERDIQSCNDPNVVRGRLARLLSITNYERPKSTNVVPLRTSPNTKNGGSRGSA